MTRKMALLSVLACITPTMLHAQERAPRPAPAKTAEPLADDNEVEALVVTAGQRLRGAVLGDIPPEETFNAADVRAFGVSSINELLAELAPQTESGRGGSPVVLLNGRRISSMAEIRDIPAEAIQRVEILPEEVALKYGYTAEQKVVNIVLRQRFRANTAELGAAAPTAGGQTTEQLDASTLRLNRDGRLNLAAKLVHSDALLESDRDLIADPADSGGLGGDRSLLPRTDQASVNAVFNKALPNNVSATLNASGSFSRTSALLGDRGGLGALEQNSRDLDGHLGFTLDGDAKKWRWSLTGNYDHGYDRTLTDRSVTTTDRARTTTDTGDLQLVVNGALARLPAGDLSTTVKLGAQGASLDAVSRRSGIETSSDQSRGGANAQLNFDLPLTSRRNNVLAGMGDLSANLNLAVNRLSDFGALTTVGYGLTWSPVKPVSFIVSMTQQENAPTMSQLGAPMVERPDARIFDFVRGETVNVTRISGGNRDLKAEERHVLKIGVTVRPPNITGLSLNANYFRTRIDDPIAAFPAATAATADAFPDRFTRDADGDLTRVDARSVNFARQESDQTALGAQLLAPDRQDPAAPGLQSQWALAAGRRRRAPAWRRPASEPVPRSAVRPGPDDRPGPGPRPAAGRPAARRRRRAFRPAGADGSDRRRCGSTGCRSWPGTGRPRRRRRRTRSRRLWRSGRPWRFRGFRPARRRGRAGAVRPVPHHPPARAGVHRRRFRAPAPARRRRAQFQRRPAPPRGRGPGRRHQERSRRPAHRQLAQCHPGRQRNGVRGGKPAVLGPDHPQPAPVRQSRGPTRMGRRPSLPARGARLLGGHQPVRQQDERARRLRRRSDQLPARLSRSAGA
jgi:hypothetical protein